MNGAARALLVKHPRVQGEWWGQSRRFIQALSSSFALKEPEGASWTTPSDPVIIPTITPKLFHSNPCHMTLTEPAFAAISFMQIRLALSPPRYLDSSNHTEWTELGVSVDLLGLKFVTKIHVCHMADFCVWSRWPDVNDSWFEVSGPHKELHCSKLFFFHNYSIYARH